MAWRRACALGAFESAKMARHGVRASAGRVASTGRRRNIEVIMADKSQGGKRETRKPKKAAAPKSPNSSKS